MPSAVYEYIGEKINAYRTQRGLTQEALADAIGVTANTISRWETATYKVTVEDLEKLSRLFEIPIWSFLPSDIQAPTEQLQALLSATGDLPEEDLIEL
ncbi:MAG: helix-turn-helix transcriptional regulator, partial [Proteobacteria bacterium]|nr:helix-turn-helix transcriptional regulator [Pseudomonadota bacterium]